MGRQIHGNQYCLLHLCTSYSAYIDSIVYLIGASHFNFLFDYTVTLIYYKYIRVLVIYTLLDRLTYAMITEWYICKQYLYNVV